jgi:hypothetical protein
MTANDVVNGIEKPSKRATALYVSYLMGIIIATFGWISFLAWLAIGLINL